MENLACSAFTITTRNGPNQKPGRLQPRGDYTTM